MTLDMVEVKRIKFILKPGGQSAGPNCPLVAPELATPEEKTFFVYYKQVLAHVSRYP